MERTKPDTDRDCRCHGEPMGALEIRAALNSLLTIPSPLSHSRENRMKPKAKRHARSRPRTHKEVQGRKRTPTLGENIKTARTKKGMTQLALAHAIGYTGDDAGA